MAKVGYIFKSEHYEGFDADVQWMKDFGCIRVVEELSEHEKLRSQWKQLLASLERGDELVLAKFSNALRGSRELAFFIEMCRVKVVRIISIHDKMDTHDELFPETKPSQVLGMIGSLPEEVNALRKQSLHVSHLKQNINARTPTAKSKIEREKNIVNMYNGGHSVDDIWRISGFHSRSSVFRILKKYDVELNRGHHQGPLKKG